MLGKVLCGLACLIAFQETGWSSEQAPRADGFVEANRHLGKLFEEPLGQKRLPELLTAFSDAEVARMRAVPGVELYNRKDSTWIGVLELEFAKAKGISKKSLFNLANYLGVVTETRHAKTVLKEVLGRIEDEFKSADFNQKCRLLGEIKELWSDAFLGLEAIRQGIKIEMNSFTETGDYENLFWELSYRRALHFFEILLLLN